MRFLLMPSYRNKNKDLLEERYKHFTVEDFIQDTFFYEWMTAPTVRHNSFWQLWLHLYPEKRAAVEEARREILGLLSGADPAVADYMEQDWQKIQAAITHTKPVSSYSRNKQRTGCAHGGSPGGAAQRIVSPSGYCTTGAAQWHAVAACFLLLLGLGLYLWWQEENNAWHYIETAYGEQQTVFLPDGSEAILNGNSQLHYAAVWKDTADRREVWLEGEAFFQITRQKGKAFQGREVPVKFTVHTSRMQVEVLGTEFNVRSRKKQTQVVLSEGSVLVHNEFKDSLLLQPGEMVELNEQQHRLARRPVNDKAYTSWKEQKLTFDNEEIAHIFHRLENTYGWKIETKDKFWLQQRYTGSVPVDQIELLFDKLAILYEMQMKKQGKKVWFNKK